MEYLHLFKTKTEHDSFYNGNKYKEPWLAYIRDNTLVTSNRTYEYYRNEYLTLSALDDGEITITIPSDVNATHATYLSYSKDKSNWTPTTIDSTDQTITILVSSGDDVYLKGIAIQLCNDGSNSVCINSTANINVSGNIMSLLYEDNFEDKTVFPDNSQKTFSFLFVNNKHLCSAEKLILPAITLAQNCYMNMFKGCTSLTTAPELPATTLASRCYSGMFNGCTSLNAAPSLPAATLSTRCYQNMFNMCASLTTAPELPATTLASSCYSSMFNGCTSLTTAPKLPATTLASYCYSYMFEGCTSLTTAPVLPATTLASDCYSNMFQGCTSLTTAPVLPATTLANYCYSYMFYGCTSLNSITMLATDISAFNSLEEWVSGVAATGTFVKAPSMTSLPSGVSGIPSGWTVKNK